MGIRQRSKMSVLNKFIGFLVDLIWRPEPSCREKPLDTAKMIGVIVGLLAIGFLLWITP